VTLTARHVVLAVGAQPFKHTPPVLAGLPAHLVSHSSDYGPLDRLFGKEVLIVGSGASALDLAALLSAKGSAVTLLTRSPTLHFQGYPVTQRSLLQRLAAPAAPGLGAGWLLRACTTPRLIHALPDRVRSTILSDTLGPCGGYFIREQVESAVQLKLGRVIEQISELGGRVRVRGVDRGGARETIAADHLIAATGYRIDVRRLQFLHVDVLRALRTIEHSPVLSGTFESSVPGLYFVGLASARSFGPIMRFVAGAVHPARRLMRALPKRLTTRRVWISSPLPQ
jgi:thioredoxin reductase